MWHYCEQCDVVHVYSCHICISQHVVESVAALCVFDFLQWRSYPLISDETNMLNEDAFIQTVFVVNECVAVSEKMDTL